MSKQFIEIVVEGNYHRIRGLLEGFLLGTGKDWKYYFSNETDIETSTFSELLTEWLSFKSRVHHIITEKDFYDSFRNAYGKFKKSIDSWKENPLLDETFIKSEKNIKSASFGFDFRTYGKKYANEIKELIDLCPNDLNLGNFKPTEKKDPSAKGMELYAPEHEYTFEGKGVVSGILDSLINYRLQMDKNPLINADKIKLEFE